jgi:hypothetical protein
VNNIAKDRQYVKGKGGNSVKYNIAGIEFKNKEEIKSYIRKIVEKYPDNTWLKPEDMNFLIEIIKLHDEAEEKIGYGISGMWIKKNPPYNTRGFWLKREDGTCTDFSWVKCVDKPKDTHKKDFYAACRTTIKDQIATFRNKAFENQKEIICPLSGEALTKSNCHIDHTYPATFQEIVKNFIKEYNLNIYSIKIEPTKDGEIETKFMYDDIADLFYNYHLEKAKLRAISKTENLKLPKKGDNLESCN